MNRRQPYCPQISQTTAEIIRVDTCDTRRSTPSCATARGNRAVVPPGHGGRGVPLSYRALAPAGADIRSGTLTVSSYSLHSTFYILHWTYTFSAKERDPETGLSYFGSRYYSSDLSIWLSADPMASKYPSMSPYVYCANNPVKLVDPNGEEIGDYYDLNGKWLGRDRNNDNLAYTVTSVVKDASGYVVSAKNKSLLPISNTELLDRATWVCGESGGSNEMITQRVQNVGDATSTNNAGVADYYAFAIHNASKYDGGFYKAVSNRMGRMINGQYKKTCEGYFEGKGLGGNVNSKAFATARASGMDAVNSNPQFTNSIAAVIRSVTSLTDPTGGCRAWLGSSSAEKYYNNPQKIYTNNKGEKAVMQFSFTSNNKVFHHTFYNL